jgi:hypothetical protein
MKLKKKMKILKKNLLIEDHLHKNSKDFLKTLKLFSIQTLLIKIKLKNLRLDLD